MINGSFAWREAGCSTGGGNFGGCFPEGHGQQENHAISLWLDHREQREALPIAGLLARGAQAVLFTMTPVFL